MIVYGKDASIVDPARAATAPGTGNVYPCDCAAPNPNDQDAPVGMFQALSDDPREPRLGCFLCGATLTHMVKILPCDGGHDALRGPGRVAYTGQTPTRFPYTYSCAGKSCAGGRVKTTLTLETWNRLPWLAPEQYLQKIGAPPFFADFQPGRKPS